MRCERVFGGRSFRTAATVRRCGHGAQSHSSCGSKEFSAHFLVAWSRGAPHTPKSGRRLVRHGDRTGCFAASDKRAVLLIGAYCSHVYAGQNETHMTGTTFNRVRVHGHGSGRSRTPTRRHRLLLRVETGGCRELWRCRQSLVLVSWHETSRTPAGPRGGKPAQVRTKRPGTGGTGTGYEGERDEQMGDGHPPVPPQPPLVDHRYRRVACRRCIALRSLLKQPLP